MQQEQKTSEVWLSKTAILISVVLFLLAIIAGFSCTPPSSGTHTPPNDTIVVPPVDTMAHTDTTIGSIPPVDSIPIPVPNIPHVTIPVSLSGSTVIMNEVSTILTGTIKHADSVETLWTMEPDKINNCYIENPDTLVTKVWFRKKGTYVFTLWAQNKHNDSLVHAEKTIVVN